MRKRLLISGRSLVLGLGWLLRGQSEFASGSHVGFEQAMHYCEHTRNNGRAHSR